MRNFQTDLKRGQQGEKDFLAMFGALVGTEGRKGDIMAPDGLIELKTDFYPMSKTKNFFIERFSSVEVLSPGGPWQAKAHNCKYFVYYYTCNKTGFIWTVDSIVKQLEALESRLTPVEITNSRWTTIGYKVARGLLQYNCMFGPNGLEVSSEFKQTIDSWGFKPVIAD